MLVSFFFFFLFPIKLYPQQQPFLSLLSLLLSVPLRVWQGG